MIYRDEVRTILSHALILHDTINKMKKKLKEWLSRYLPLEIVATITAIVGGLVSYYLTNNPVIIAFTTAWSENIGYYVAVIIHELKTKKGKISFGEICKTARDIVFEFGIAESLDNLLLRPFFMYIMPILLGNLLLGLIAGKIATDILFYITTIIFYEIKKKVFVD
ncbi:MAG: hypothetical protein JWP09_887 [Candidatus Taylorbacteria bacterium]|nr:hypothetical protein [Candidatus Taylorbacteria bacterium]